MRTPLEALEDAILTAEQAHKRDNDPTSKYWGFQLYARAAADVLTSDVAVRAAVAALVEAGWGQAHAGDRGLSTADLADLARTVLRSVRSA